MNKERGLSVLEFLGRHSFPPFQDTLTTPSPSLPFHHHHISSSSSSSSSSSVSRAPKRCGRTVIYKLVLIGVVIVKSPRLGPFLSSHSHRVHGGLIWSFSTNIMTDLSLREPRI
ncbi:hypothetical protein E2C01_097380 [Portunus trituberculatus]|uniref:Uncharacterized protein n=1 Tax=Portunus trituberculatus TaxID=210409 RepID=A0A5B7KB45_PORTR|nr:hypothetical protein [Portunus trituberculatus]